MFVDASVLVALLKREPDSLELANRLEQDDSPITSPIAILETISLARQKTLAAGVAHSIVSDLVDRAEIEIRAVDHVSAALAADAHERYGKGSGHPARLNLGDCLAYAMARQHGVRLLYKGDDFVKTDLA